MHISFTLFTFVDMNWTKYETDLAYLIKLGYEMQILTYQVCNYEDEDFNNIMVKDDIALIHGLNAGDTWSKGKLSNCNFHDGFDTSSQIIDIYTL